MERARSGREESGDAETFLLLKGRRARGLGDAMPRQSRRAAWTVEQNESPRRRAADSVPWRLERGPKLRGFTFPLGRAGPPFGFGFYALISKAKGSLPKDTCVCLAVLTTDD